MSKMEPLAVAVEPLAVEPSLITKPLLAGIFNNEKIEFPVYCTPKIDGIRSLKIEGKIVSRTFKPIRNAAMRNLLESLLPEGSDGEIQYGANFQECTSVVMTASKNFEDLFTYYWFDWVKDDAKKEYLDRIADMKGYIDAHPSILNHHQVKIVPLFPVKINTLTALNVYEEEALKEGHEGIMVRSPHGHYKMGRSTTREGILLKVKRFQDAEAIIVGTEEQCANTNVVEKRPTGNVRSVKKEGLVHAGVLGSLAVQWSGHPPFRIGTGFTEQERIDLWNMRHTLVGKRVKFKYFENSSKNTPRFPVFLGIRDDDD